MEGPSQWSEADIKKARMEHVCIISHVNLLFVLRSRGEFCLLKNGHFPLAPCPRAEKTKNVVLLSASTLRQDAPKGLGSEELPKNKTKPNYCFLQIIHVSKTSRWRIWGSLCQGQNMWGAALRRNNIIRPCLSAPQPKAQPEV